MTDKVNSRMATALEARLRTAQGNVAEAEAWLQTVPSNHPDYEDAVEELAFWKAQSSEIAQQVTNYGG